MRSFAQVVRRVRTPAIVFIRYGHDHNVHRSLSQNLDVPARLSTWLVQDRGADNLKLIDSAPNRTPYLYDERLGMLQRLNLRRRDAREVDRGPR
jgi:hypothetical protein